MLGRQTDNTHEHFQNAVLLGAIKGNTGKKIRNPWNETGAQWDRSTLTLCQGGIFLTRRTKQRWTSRRSACTVCSRDTFYLGMDQQLLYQVPFLLEAYIFVLFFGGMKMHLPAILMFTRVARSWAINHWKSLRRCICHILLPVNGTKRAGRCSTALTIAEMPRAPDGFDKWKSREIKTDVLTILMKIVLSPNLKYAPEWIGPFFSFTGGFSEVRNIGQRDYKDPQ